MQVFGESGTFEIPVRPDQIRSGPVHTMSDQGYNLALGHFPPKIV